MKNPTRTTLTRPVAALLAVLAMLPAAASAAGDTPAEWHGLIGIGVGSKPLAPGSAGTKTQVTPVGKVSYGKFFIGGGAGLGIGYTALERGGLSAGFAISRDSSAERDQADAPRLQGLGDIDPTMRAGLFVQYRHDWLRASASVMRDVGGNKQGTVASATAEAVFRPIPALELSAGPSVTFGNRQYAQTAFGVDALQASRSGLPRYAPEGGATQAALQFGAGYALSNSWVLGVKLSAGRLRGDAAASPVVEKKAQNSGAVFAAYKF